MTANGLQIGDGRAFQHPPAGGLVRSTELSATTKLSSGDETPPIANVLLAVRAFLCLLLLLLSSNYFFFSFQLCEQDDGYNAKHKLLYFRQPCKFFRVQDE
jgi:hypothetical protein